MTRKDFEAIAVALKRSRPIYAADVPMLEQWKRDVDAVALVFAAGNPRFDLARFRTACAYEVE